MTSQLLSSKLPLQGQKELETKQKDLAEKDGEKDLYKTLREYFFIFFEFFF